MGEPVPDFVRTAAPLYRDVAAALERRIRGGTWKPGTQIPTEAQLESEFGASRGTLRMAIAELVRRGLLHPQPGRGTFVLDPSLNSLERYFRYEGTGSVARLQPQNRVLKCTTKIADRRIAAALNIEPGERVGHVRRLRMHEGEPFLLIDSFFHPEVWRQIAQADFRAHPLYDVLRDSHRVFITSADEYLQAGLVGATEARLLRIAPLSAVILIERTARTFDDRPVEFRLATGRADRFRYHVRLE